MKSGGNPFYSLTLTLLCPSGCSRRERGLLRHPPPGEGQGEGIHASACTCPDTASLIQRCGTPIVAPSAGTFDKKTQQVPLWLQEPYQHSPATHRIRLSQAKKGFERSPGRCFHRRDSLFSRKMSIRRKYQSILQPLFTVYSISST